MENDIINIVTELETNNKLNKNIINKKTVQLWCCGHTHNNFNFEINDVRIISNQRGYPQSVLKTYKNYFKSSLTKTK